MRLPEHLAEQLSRVPKSSDGYCDYAPCQVTLKSGKVLDRVYLLEQVAFRRMWGDTEVTVAIDDVEMLAESPSRLPVQWANELYAAGESGMGYTLFVARLKSGAALTYVVGNAVDFPNWPPGVGPDDVLEVVPHDGRKVFRDRAPGHHERSAPYDWCVYDA